MEDNTNNAIHGIPEPTLRRLPAYCQVLRRIGDREYVSCTQIGRELHLDPTQVRKDLALAGANGRPKVGYPVAELFQTIETFLGWNNAQDAILVGAGHLGTALLGYKPFEKYGVKIIAAFDTAPEKHGQKIHDVAVFPLKKLPNLLDRIKVHIGILTVPAQEAQTVCNLMTDNGILAIWNFAPIALAVPDGVIVQQENLFSSMGILSSKLAAKLRVSPPSSKVSLLKKKDRI